MKTSFSDEARDAKGTLIGRYVYLGEDTQDEFDAFCDSWLKTYDNHNEFFLTIDLETTGLQPHKGQILLISISWDGKNAIVFSPRYFNLDKFKEVLAKIPINNQNIKFDLKWLLYHYGIECQIYFDTMVGTQMGWAGVFPEVPQGTFGLANIAKNLLEGYALEKETRKQFIGMDPSAEFSREQIEYAVKDALITHKLVWPIFKRLHNHNLWELWETIEKPLLQELVRTEVYGVKIDTKKLEELLLSKELELHNCYSRIETLLAKENINTTKFPKGKFNPGSSQQIVTVLNHLGIKVLNTEKGTLQIAQANYKNDLLGEIIEWRKLKGIISKFLTKWLEEHIDPNTGCIYTSFNTYGAETGRMCVSGDTLVETTRGRIPIKDLYTLELQLKQELLPLIPPRVRSIVYTHTGNKQNVLDKIYKGDEEMYEVELANGSKIECTMAHKFLTPDGWKPLAELKEDDILISYEGDPNEKSL